MLGGGGGGGVSVVVRGWWWEGVISLGGMNEPVPARGSQGCCALEQPRRSSSPSVGSHPSCTDFDLHTTSVITTAAAILLPLDTPPSVEGRKRKKIVAYDGGWVRPLTRTIAPVKRMVLGLTLEA